jgi:hypothetical protein
MGELNETSVIIKLVSYSTVFIIVKGGIKFCLALFLVYSCNHVYIGKYIAKIEVRMP